LWGHGPATVREIHGILNQTKPTGYTTVLKLIQIMAEKALVRRNEVQNQRAHVYEASLPKEQTQRQLVGDLVGRAFDGSASELVMQALSAKTATPQELEEIRKLLDNYERGAK
jgi:BlaI family penicillinase repressor